ncbi:hypothetical protein ACJQWK_04564 [Exserohilum turcicum]
MDAQHDPCQQPRDKDGDMAETREKRVVVIGGSIAGLMHTLALKSHGHSVIVLEMRSEQQLQARAAGLSLWPNAQQLLQTYIPDVDLDGLLIRNPSFPIMDKDGNVLVDVPFQYDVRTSCWAGIHGLLRMACERHVDTHGPVAIRSGCSFTGLADCGSHMVVTYRDKAGSEHELTADLVVGADGARSKIRSIVLPELKTEYMGYLAWRSYLPEDDAPQELKCTVQGKMPQCMLGGSYIVVYLSPDDHGSMRPGERVVEWCWYDACDAATPTFAEYMTDVNGVCHNSTVPSDLLRQEVWDAQIKRRQSALSPLWQRIFQQSRPPLLTAVRAFDNTRASFFNGKLLLVGEAFTQIRPHLGASCDIAAVSALHLPRVLSGEMPMRELETKVAKHAMEKAIGSKATGIFGMTGKWPDGFTAEGAAKFAEKL